MESKTNLEYRGRVEARLRGRARGDRGERGERGERGDRGERGERWLLGERGVRERGDRELDCARRRSSSLRFARISFSRIIRLNASRGSSAALRHNLHFTLCYNHRLYVDISSICVYGITAHRVDIVVCGKFRSNGCQE